MARHGRTSDWLGAVEDETFLDDKAIPRHSRVVKFAAIKTAADAREYARRLFHGAVAAAKGKTGDALDRWALAAKQYVLAHDLAGQGGSLADVLAGLHAANLNTDAAVKKPPGPRVLWTPPAHDAPEGPAAPPAAPSSSPPSAPAPPAPEPASGAVAIDTGAGATEPAPATVASEWLQPGLLPGFARKVAFKAIRTLDDVKNYAARFFAGNVDHGNRAGLGPAVRQRFAEAARIYVYAHRLAKLPPSLTGGVDLAEPAGIDALTHDLAAADIMTAQALAAEKGAALPSLAINWFTTPTLAPKGIATFKITGDLTAPSSATPIGPVASTPTPSPVGAEPASSTTPAPSGKQLPRTFDAIINRFRGVVPIEYVRALIMAESGYNPHDENATSTARGLLQITPVVLEDWNKAHPTQTATADDLFDPTVNLRMGLDLLGRIVTKFATAHPATMAPAFSIPRYIEVLSEAWNIGANGIAFIVGKLEAAGLDVTLTNVVNKGPTFPGVAESVGKRITARGTKFPIRVRKLYFDELEAAAPAAPGAELVASSGGVTMGEGLALALVGGLLLFGDQLDGKRGRRR